MAPLVQNLTGRVFFDYSTGLATTSKEHTASLRTSMPVADASQVQQVFLDVLLAFGATQFRVGWRVNVARYQAPGTDFSVPVPLLAGLGAFVGTASGIATTLQECAEDSFQARSMTTGRRTKFSLYLANGLPEATFRISVGASGLPLAVQSATNALNAASTVTYITGVDGSVPRWYAYMNQNINSYWEREQRS